MDEETIREIIGKPSDKPALTEVDHFEQCPACGGWFDCRNLEDVMSHLGPHKAEPRQ